MTFLDRRKEWSEIRLDFYSSGRLLYSQGLFFGGAIQLTYAIEMSLKALAYEFCDRPGATQKFKKKYTNSHDIVKIYEALEALGAIDGISISKDFLKYLNYFSERYPSKIIERKKEMARDYGGGLQGVNLISYYDYMMIELDKRIFELSEDTDTLILLNGIKHGDWNKNMCLLPGNSMLKRNLDYYRDILVNQTNVDQEKVAESLDKLGDIETLKFDVKFSPQPSHPAFIQEINDAFQPENFELPKTKGHWKV
jgi:hypothetical protein